MTAFAEALCLASSLSSSTISEHEQVLVACFVNAPSPIGDMVGQIHLVQVKIGSHLCEQVETHGKLHPVCHHKDTQTQETNIKRGGKQRESVCVCDRDNARVPR